MRDDYCGAKRREVKGIKMTMKKIVKIITANLLVLAFICSMTNKSSFAAETASIVEKYTEEDNVVLRLHFRLRGSVRAGDVCDLIVEDAVFAASDEKSSHAMTRGTLRTKDSRIVVGE